MPGGSAGVRKWKWAMSSGGKRSGAGRKAQEPGKPRVVVSFTLSQRSREVIQILRARGLNVGHLIDEFFQTFVEK